MAVLIGGASINEYGKLEGGKPGDQTGTEVYEQPWYLHPKGWVVLRAKSPIVRAKMAQDMRYACANDFIGYSYWDHCYTLYNEVKKYDFDCSKVDIPCETNCAKLVRVCALYAGVKVRDFSTENEVNMFMETGLFSLLKEDKYCKSSDWLLEGDILITSTKGHTCIVLSNGSKTGAGVPYRTANCAFCNMRSGGSINNTVLETLKCDERVTLFDWSESGWGFVRNGDKEGYISPLYLAELFRAKASGDVWLREAPGTSGMKLVVIPKGTIVHITGETKLVGQTPWYYTIYDGIEGWASGKYIKPIK